MLQPVRWAKGRDEQFRQYMDAELHFTRAARQTLEQQWREWLIQYRAPAKQPTKRFPYEGAPNYVLPLTATDIDQLAAKFMTTIHAPDNLWTCRAMNERWLDAAKPLQDFLEWLQTRVLGMWDVNYRVILEMLKLGTGIYKTGWRYEKRPVTLYDENGNPLKATKIRSLPFVDHVRCLDFWLPPTAYAIQPDEQGGAAWVAERMEMRLDQLEMFAQSSDGYLPPIARDDFERIKASLTDKQTEYDRAIVQADYLKRQGLTVNFDTSTTAIATQTAIGPNVPKVELFEVHVRYNAQGDEYNDLVVWYHPMSHTIARAILQPYNHGRRPYDVARYFRGDGFWGIGVAEQKEVFQRAQSQQFNDIMTNSELANARMYAMKEGANIAPGEPVYPGRVIITEGDPRAEVSSFNMADVYPSAYQNFSLLQAMGERRTGISDIQLGNIQQLPGRTPATTMLSLMQEGSLRPDLTIKDMRYAGLSNVGLRILQLSQQYISTPGEVSGQRMLKLAVELLGTPEGYHAAEKLATPLEDAELGLGVTITATSGSQNKEVARQNNLARLQLAGTLYPQFIQMAQVATVAQAQGMGGVAQIAFDSMKGLAELFTRTLEEDDVRNPEVVVPSVDQAAQAQQSAGPQPGPGGGAGALDPNALMAALGMGAGNGTGQLG